MSDFATTAHNGLPGLSLWILYALASAILYQLYVLAQRLYVSPLRKIPGPKKAAIHDFFNFRLQEIPFEALLQIHKTYGPVVRTGPNEVLVSSASELSKIYRVEHSLQKSAFYEMFRSPGVEGPMFSMRDEKIHRSRRKLLNPAYSKSSVTAIHPWVLRQCEIACDQISSAVSNGETIEIFRYYRMLAGDTALKAAFNIDAGMVKNASVHPIMQQIKIEVGTPFYIRNFARRLVPYTPQWVIDALPASFKTQLFAMSKVEALSREYLTAYVKEINDAPGDQKAEAMSWILDAKNPATNEPLSIAELTAEARSLILAGSDTTATTLTYATWLIFRHPDVLHKLREELATVMGDNHHLPTTLTPIESLPYLTACINEAMRLYPAIPGPFPRIVPTGGLVIDGYYLPEGTVVGASALAVHRSDVNGVWGKDVDKYRPERWLGGAGEPDPLVLKRTLLTFGMGTRSCIGREVAMMQVYAMTAAFVSRFDASIPSGYTPDMRTAGTFNMSIKGGSLLLQVKEVV